MKSIWVEFSWQCACGAGYAEASHNRRVFPERHCSKCGALMTLTKRSLEYEDREPDEMIHVPSVIATTFGISRSEARRAIAQKGVRVDGRLETRLDVPADEFGGGSLSLGKRRGRLSARLLGPYHN